VCDNSRECRASAARGFAGAGRKRPLDDEPDVTPMGCAPTSVRPGYAQSTPVGGSAGGGDASGSAVAGSEGLGPDDV